MKRFDIILTISIIIIAVAFAGLNKYRENTINENSEELWVEIYVEHELYKKIQLSQESQQVIIETSHGKNVISVHDKGIEVIEADCPDHICEGVGFMDKPGEIIVCLPNKVVIEIKGDMKEEIDGLSN